MSCGGAGGVCPPARPSPTASTSASCDGSVRFVNERRSASQTWALRPPATAAKCFDFWTGETTGVRTMKRRLPTSAFTLFQLLTVLSLLAFVLRPCSCRPSRQGCGRRRGRPNRTTTSSRSASPLHNYNDANGVFPPGVDDNNFSAAVQAAAVHRTGPGLQEDQLHQADRRQGQRRRRARPSSRRSSARWTRSRRSATTAAPPTTCSTTRSSSSATPRSTIPRQLPGRDEQHHRHRRDAQGRRRRRKRRT